MKNYSSKTTGFDDAYILQSLFNKSQQLKRLSKIVCEQLPIEYQDKIFVLNYHNKLLLLGTNEQLLASKLRYLLPQLKNALLEKAAFKNLLRVKVKVTSLQQPAFASNKQKQKTHLIYSDKSSQLLSEFSDSLEEEDSALQSSLKRLAQHIRLNQEKNS